MPLPPGGRFAIAVDAVPSPRRRPAARHGGGVQVVDIVFDGGFALLAPRVSSGPPAKRCIITANANPRRRRTISNESRLGTSGRSENNFAGEVALFKNHFGERGGWASDRDTDLGGWNRHFETRKSHLKLGALRPSRTGSRLERRQVGVVDVRITPE